MTAAEVLERAAVEGLDVALVGGRPVVRGGRPNAALLAALKEHRAGIVRLLGGTPEPERCKGYTCRAKGKDGVWADRTEPCGSWVTEAVDDMFFCPATTCPWRSQTRRHG